MIGLRIFRPLALCADRLSLALLMLAALGSASAVAATSNSSRIIPHAAAASHSAAGVVLPPPSSEIPHVVIPALSGTPQLADFLPEKPQSDLVRSMLRVNNFTERYPDDGAPATEATVAYVGYTREHLYVAFVCSDSETRSIRAHMLKRDQLSNDDFVQIMLDTFHDSRRAFVFKVNALGVQADALYSEQTGSDYSFDTVWDSWGQRTPHGYVALMRIPFASLRFGRVPSGTPRQWGIILQRGITRKDEFVYWPQVKHNVAGQLTQEAVAEGFEDIEPGKNSQIQPYSLAHSFRQLNTVDANNPFFSDKNLQGYAGVDIKSVLHNSLVLDMTVNPDFSQIGVNNPAPPNQRFQYYFPELRPFFIENSSYFQTPLNLYYTPNIVMPQFGERLTGKVGKYALGILSVDDREPGLEVTSDDPAYGSRTHSYVGRVNRDIGNQSNLGVIYADQEYMSSFNRNGGADYRVRVRDRWTFTGQAVTSETRNTDSSWQSGQVWTQSASYTDLHTGMWFNFRDVAAGYTTATGFFTRPDIRQPHGSFSYTFRPAHGPLLAHGLNFYAQRTWDHTGLPLDFYFDPEYSFSFKHSTSLSFVAFLEQDRLRPSDYSDLPANVDYHSNGGGASFSTSPSPLLAVGVSGYAGQAVNYSPPDGKGPSSVGVQSDHLNLDVKPLRPLDLSSSYEFDRFSDPATGAVVYDNHQLVTRWNVQMDRAWSLNFIGEYLATLPNNTYTSLSNNKDIFGDVLLTYLPHPGTAFYVGYTSDYTNLNSSLCTRGATGVCNTNDPILPRTTGVALLNDQRVLYLKINHLFRF
jgi:hypothetical protein